MLDLLVEEVGENEQHPRASLVDVLGMRMARYEDEQVAELPAHAIKLVRHNAA